MLRKLVMFIGLAGLLLTVWPPTFSPYQLSGEEALPGQMLSVMQWVNTAVRPQPKLAPNAAIEHSHLSPFGMNVFLEQEVLPEVREEALRLLSEAGFKYIRQQFVWEEIEHAKDDFIDRRNDPNGVDAWHKFDNITDLSEQYGIEIIARLDNPPKWTRAVGNGTDDRDAKGPPDNFDDYGDFVATVVGRYKGRITYFQLWNEPNIFDEWGDRAPNPEQFTELLCIGYTRAKAANPDAVILSPALSPTADNAYNNMSELLFLQRMYQAGAGDCFDILSVQGYGLRSGPPDKRLQATAINANRHLLVRDVMVTNGDETKPIWIAEAGWNSVPDGLSQNFGQVSEQQRADYAVEMYERIQNEWPWIGVTNYWFFKRPAPLPEQAWYYFRTMEPDFTPLPVWDALAAYATADGGPQTAEQLSVNSWPLPVARPIIFSISLFLFFFPLFQSLIPKKQ